MQFTPNLIASGDISPFRFVSISGDSTCAVTADDTTFIVGVTEGSTVDFTSDLHASAGLETSLQTGLIVRIEAGGTFSAGDTIVSDSVGRGIVATTQLGAAVAGVALQAGAIGEEIQIYFVPHFADVA